MGGAGGSFRIAWLCYLTGLTRFNFEPQSYRTQCGHPLIVRVIVATVLALLGQIAGYISKDTPTVVHNFPPSAATREVQKALAAQSRFLS